MPGIEQESNHTHLRRPTDPETTTKREYEFMHSAFFSWDGKVVATMDEVGGGVEARCFGPHSKDGYYYFYDVVEPGSPEPPLRSRYTIPRQQGDTGVRVAQREHDPREGPIPGVRRLLPGRRLRGGLHRRGQPA